MAGFGKRAVSTVVEVGVGAATYFVAAKSAPWLASKIAIFQKPYSMPITLAVAALLIRGKKDSGGRAEVATAVAGAAGALAATTYYVQASTTPAPQPAPMQTPASPAAGMLMQPGSAGRLPYWGHAGAAYYRRRTAAGMLVT